ncbi:MAG: phosphatase PAP2 family protein [Acidimicrobiia bacterium]
MIHPRVVKTAAASVILLASARAAQRGVSQPENRIYRAVNDLPDDIAPAAWLPMQAGALAYPLMLSGSIYWRTRTPQPAISIAAAGVSAWLGAKIVKKAVGRGRPYDFDQSTNLRLGTQTEGSLGFIAGHAAGSFAVASVVSDRLVPIPGVAAYAAAATASVSRLYVGAHLPLDIVGDAAFGIVLGEIAEVIASKIRVA